MKKHHWTILLAGLGLAVLILDTKTAIYGMTEGIAICLQTLIPSLFPFIILSMLLTTSLLGRKIPVIGPLCRLLGIPLGAESIFVVGLLGGYPVGAQCIAQAVRNGHISRGNGERMLSFCSNAGPAFLFGLGIWLFPSVWYCWILWGIHILSAMAVGFLTPCRETNHGSIAGSKPIALPAALRTAIQTMALICGWVVIFRVILAFCQRWFLWMLPELAQQMLTGILELANGCCALAQVSSLETRFVLFNVFLGFGGLCVVMQTGSVCEGLNLSWYLRGKTMQAAIGFLLAIQYISREMRIASIIALVMLCFVYNYICRNRQKGVAFFRKSVYNEENCKRGNCHAFPQKNRALVRILRPQHAPE